MKTWWLLIVMSLVCSGVVAADNIGLRVMVRDYSVLDLATRPIAFGAVLWENSELPNHPGAYGSMALATYGNLRLEAGGCGVWNEKKVRVEIAMLTGLSYEIYDNWIIGAWAAPFWNTYGKNPDDAWGLMIGYTWGVGE